LENYGFETIRFSTILIILPSLEANRQHLDMEQEWYLLSFNHGCLTTDLKKVNDRILNWPPGAHVQSSQQPN
jgi:hypothetical protein